MSLKCVSRQWLALITTPHFRNLLPPLRASGLFFQRTKVYFVHLDDQNTPSPFRPLAFAHDPCDPERICIVQSCSGLLLCSTDNHALVDLHKRNHYVYSPSTSQVDTLPKHPCHNCYGLPRINLIFDPLKSLHYKVISYLTGPRSGDFYIYSSETRTWRLCIQLYVPAPTMCLRRDGVYWNGCMHWLSQYHESSSPDSLYFNVEEERLVTFPSPPMSGRSSHNSCFGESEGHLHYTEVWPFASSFSVYEMKSDYSEWFVKYQIDLVPISKVFREMKDCPFYTVENYYNAAVVSVIRRENFKEDSFLVMELPGKIIRYNLVDRSFKVIWDFVADFKLHGNLGHWKCGYLKGWPNIEWPNH